MSSQQLERKTFIVYTPWGQLGEECASIVSEAFFTPEKGFGESEIQAVNELEVDTVHTVTCPSMMKVIRVK